MFTNRLFCLLILIALPILSACTAPAASSPPPIATTAPSEPPATSLAAPSAISSPVSTRPACPDPHGGVCRGDLGPGIYTTLRFQPAITYTVPEGWTNLEDLAGNFLLQRSADIRDMEVSIGPFVGVYQNVVAPDGCNERRDPQVGQSVNDLIAWFQTNEQLSVTEPKPVTIGGLKGFYIDVAKAPDAPSCSWELEAKYGKFAPLVIGGGVSQLLHVSLSPAWKERLYLLSFGEDGNVPIEVGPEGGSLHDYLAAVEPILATFTFGQ